MDPLVSLGVAVDVTARDGQALKADIREWLLGACSAQDTELVEAALASGGGRSGWLPPDRPWGPPGELWSSLVAGWPRGSGVSARPVDDAEKRGPNVYRKGPLTTKRLDWILASEQPLPTFMSVNVFRLGDQGGKPDDVGAEGCAAMHHDPEDEPATATLWARMSPGLDDLVSVLSFAKEKAHELEISFGQAGPAVSGYRTALEESIPYPPLGTREADQGRDFLRGYNWVTIVPPQLLQRLGGSESVRAGGAFFAVEDLRNGGAWLQATPTLEDFDRAAVWRVFETLAPILPAGMPIDRTLPVPIPGSTTGASAPGNPTLWAVAIADADDYR